MKTGQSVLQAAQKLAKRHIRTTVGKAVNPISEEAKQYIATLVETDIPEMAEEILMMDIQDIVDTVLDFAQVHQTHNGIGVEIALENLTGLIESITSMVNHNPAFIEEPLNYFDDLGIDVSVIEGIRDIEKCCKQAMDEE